MSSTTSISIFMCSCDSPHPIHMVRTLGFMYQWYRNCHKFVADWLRWLCGISPQICLLYSTVQHQDRFWSSNIYVGSGISPRICLITQYRNSCEFMYQWYWNCRTLVADWLRWHVRYITAYLPSSSTVGHQDRSCSSNICGLRPRGVLSSQYLSSKNYMLLVELMPVHVFVFF